MKFCYNPPNGGQDMHRIADCCKKYKKTKLAKRYFSKMVCTFFSMRTWQGMSINIGVPGSVVIILEKCKIAGRETGNNYVKDKILT